MGTGRLWWDQELSAKIMESSIQAKPLSPTSLPILHLLLLKKL